MPVCSISVIVAMNLVRADKGGGGINSSGAGVGNLRDCHNELGEG